eukprot:Hpha_TRINITY_DN8854_c0_g1::TRINITY_DN8854_c0_g1_i1::g.141542::m.141542
MASEVRSSSAQRRSNSKASPESLTSAYPQDAERGDDPSSDDDRNHRRPPRPSSQRSTPFAALAAAAAGLLIGLVLLPNIKSRFSGEGGAGGERVIFKTVKAKQEEVREMLRDLGRERYTEALFAHGLDRVEYIARAEEPDRLETGVKKKSWAMIVEEAQRRARSIEDEPADMVPVSKAVVSRAVKRAQTRQEEVMEMLRDMGRERYADALITHGLDRLEFIAKAEDRDREDLGIRRKTWKAIVAEARRRQGLPETAGEGGMGGDGVSGEDTGRPDPRPGADPRPGSEPERPGADPALDPEASPRKRKSMDAEEPVAPAPKKKKKKKPSGGSEEEGKRFDRPRGTEDGLETATSQKWKFVALPGGYKCPHDCRPIEKPSGCHVAAAAANLETPPKVREISGSAEEPKGCFYRYPKSKQGELGINLVKGTAAAATPELWMLCRCATWPKFVASTTGTCSTMRAGKCKPLASKENCEEAAKFVGLLEGTAGLNSASLRQRRPPGCHYRTWSTGKRRLFFNPDMESAQESTAADFSICECEPGDRPESAWPAPAPVDGHSSLKEKASKDPETAAKLLVNRIWEEFRLPEPQKSFHLVEKQRQEHIARRRAQAPEPQKYDSDETLAYAVLRRIGARDKAHAGKVVGTHRFRILDEQQRANVVATASGQTYEELVKLCLPVQAQACIKKLPSKEKAGIVECEQAHSIESSPRIEVFKNLPAIVTRRAISFREIVSNESPAPGAAGESGGGESKETLAKQHVNSIWEKFGMGDPPRGFREQEEMKNTHASERRASLPNPAEYDVLEEKAIAELKLYSMRDRTLAARAVGMHRHRILDNQEKLAVTKIYGARLKENDQAALYNKLGKKVVGSSIGGTPLAVPSATPAPPVPVLPPPQLPPPTPPPPLTPTLLAELKGFEELLKMGALSQAEFERNRRDIYAKAAKSQ